ncbi:MAG: transcriptional regulator, partial [Leptolyngbyaceae cyanobacterium]
MISVKQWIQLIVGATILWTASPPVNAQESNSTPIYTDPPPRVVPLPSERTNQTSPLANTYQVGALEAAYPGSL